MLSKEKNKGITLIALIITIIVLLILAGVTINALTGSDSVMNKAYEARIQNEKGEISDVIGLAYTNIILEHGIRLDSYDNYFETKEKFYQWGNISSNYVIVDEEGKQYNYDAEAGKVTFFIYKSGGTGTQFEFEIDLKNEKIICKSEVQTNYNGTNGNGQQGEEHTGGRVNRLDDAEENVTICENVDANFYVCDDSGNRLDGFGNWFDNDLSTYVDRSNGALLQIKWDGNISGKQIKVKANYYGTYWFRLQYIDSNGNVINAYTTNGELSAYLNYNNGESVTYVPDNAVAIIVMDYTGHNIYEVQVLEDGKYENNYISNIKAFGVTSNKIGLRWNQDTSVQKVKIYKDGMFVGESSNSEFVLATGLKSYTDYDFYLEPITDKTTEAFQNDKLKISVKTKKDIAGFYFANLDEKNSKYYSNWIDGNTESYLSRDKSEEIVIKWTENIVGKQICVKASSSAGVYFYAKYINDNGNVINSLKPNGTSTGVLNYNSGDSITYVPEGATGIVIKDNTGDSFYDISVLEDGAYWTNHITNVGAVNLDKHSLNLTWDKTDDVIKTKVYQDGIYIGETEGDIYAIEGGLLSNTQYTYSLEPITAYTVNGARNIKTSATFTTKSDGVDFQVEGTDNITKKYYKNLFDANLNTYMNAEDSVNYRITWSGDITGKQIYVKADGSYNSYFYIVYIDSNGNVLNAVKPDGSTTNYVNYNNGESITFVPNGATSLFVKDDIAGNNYYEIGLFEQGKYLEEKITDVRTTNVQARSITLNWNKKNDVVKTKIYIDGKLLGETNDTSYTINSNLTPDTEYIIYLEPITDVEGSDRIMKSIIRVKTSGDGQ